MRSIIANINFQQELACSRDKEKTLFEWIKNADIDEDTFRNLINILQELGQRERNNDTFD